jgi:hypothetical protein
MRDVETRVAKTDEGSISMIEYHMVDYCFAFFKWCIGQTRNKITQQFS